MNCIGRTIGCDAAGINNCLVFITSSQNHRLIRGNQALIGKRLVVVQYLNAKITQYINRAADLNHADIAGIVHGLGDIDRLPVDDGEALCIGGDH